MIVYVADFTASDEVSPRPDFAEARGSATQSAVSSAPLGSGPTAFDPCRPTGNDR